MQESLRTALQLIYEEADRDIAAAGPVCKLSGRCCRFTEYGHTLFISNLEAKYLLEEIRTLEQPVNESGCPFQIDKLCTARERRPLGCRIFHCDPDYEETGNQITEKYLARLKALADHHGIQWMYAPIHLFLNR